jgi:hypothetical protein
MHRADKNAEMLGTGSNFARDMIPLSMSPTAKFDPVPSFLSQFPNPRAHARIDSGAA